MATGNSGAKARVLILVVILVAVAAVGWYRMKNGGFGGGANIETTVVNGDLLGKKLEDATSALGAQPVEQPNPDSATSTAKIYLYTIPGAQPDRQLVRVRVAANGNIIATNFVDASGAVIVVDRPN